MSIQDDIQEVRRTCFSSEPAFDRILIELERLVNEVSILQAEREILDNLLRESISMQLCDLSQSDSWASHVKNCRKCAFAEKARAALAKINKEKK